MKRLCLGLGERGVDQIHVHEERSGSFEPLSKLDSDPRHFESVEALDELTDLLLPPPLVVGGLSSLLLCSLGRDLALVLISP